MLYFNFHSTSLFSRVLVSTLLGLQPDPASLPKVRCCALGCRQNHGLCADLFSGMKDIFALKPVEQRNGKRRQQWLSTVPFDCHHLVRVDCALQELVSVWCSQKHLCWERITSLNAWAFLSFFVLHKTSCMYGNYWSRQALACFS